jgi:hypothetical protein
MLYEKFNSKKIPSAYGMDMNAIFSMDMNEIIKQGGIEEVMLREAEKTGGYELGMSTMSIEHKDLMKIKENLEFVDSLPLKELCRNAGQLDLQQHLRMLIRDFEDVDEHLRAFNTEKFKINDLLNN